MSHALSLAGNFHNEFGNTDTYGRGKHLRRSVFVSATYATMTAKQSTEVTAMKIQKIGVAVLVLIALTVSITTLTTNKYFSHIGGILIVALCVWGAIAFSKNEPSGKGRS